MMTTSSKKKNRHILSVSIAVTISAVLIPFIREHVPPSEITFVTSTCLFCVFFIVITADPTTFYIIFGPWLPSAAWRLHGRKAVRFLERGGQLAQKKAAKS